MICETNMSRNIVKRIKEEVNKTQEYRFLKICEV